MTAQLEGIGMTSRRTRMRLVQRLREGGIESDRAPRSSVRPDEVQRCFGFLKAARCHDDPFHAGVRSSCEN